MMGAGSIERFTSGSERAWGCDSPGPLQNADIFIKKYENVAAEKRIWREKFTKTQQSLSDNL
jgi:hypothetical protein